MLAQYRELHSTYPVKVNHNGRKNIKNNVNICITGHSVVGRNQHGNQIQLPQPKGIFTSDCAHLLSIISSAIWWCIRGSPLSNLLLSSLRVKGLGLLGWMPTAANKAMTDTRWSVSVCLCFQSKCQIEFEFKLIFYRMFTQN